MVLLALALALGCATSPPDTNVLQASDLTAAHGSFNANEIVDLASFTDATSITNDQLQAFLESTPYGQQSFLDTYSSNGVRADDALIATATKYTLNPLVFLVAAEEAQGLVGQPYYPSTPSIVEYVFNCGCATAQNSCDPSLAGFNLQIDCLGNAIRSSLDAIGAAGQTAGGWAPGKAMATLDGIRVVPADASTAAIYQYIPTVNTGAAGGTWLFWNLWQKYAAALGYAGGGTVAATASIGDPCTVSGACAFQGGQCATNFPGGLCTATCTSSCPTDPKNTPAFCADFEGQGGYCLPICNPSASVCRSGYVCEQVAQEGDSTNGQYVCVPSS
jgi:hypothetical protein